MPSGNTRKNQAEKDPTSTYGTKNPTNQKDAETNNISPTPMPIDGGGSRKSDAYLPDSIEQDMARITGEVDQTDRKTKDAASIYEATKSTNKPEAK